jgi:hypothetical protein
MDGKRIASTAKQSAAEVLGVRAENILVQLARHSMVPQSLTQRAIRGSLDVRQGRY